jgi:hypothetical protein
MNPLSARFQTMDSFEGNVFEPASLHKYLYAEADPVNKLDPSGHNTLVETTETIDFFGVMVKSLRITFTVAKAAAVTCAAVYDGTSILAFAGVDSHYSGPCGAPRKEHRGRLQVQGADLRRGHGTDTLSRPWAAASPLRASVALLMLGELMLELNDSELGLRDEAFTKAERFIENASRSGGVGPTIKTFQNRNLPRRNTDARVDIEVQSGFAFVP